jgi:branched-chain amino acid transport system substrate-binding protein
VLWNFCSAIRSRRPARGSIRSAIIADYIRTHTFKTVIGDVEFGEKGEWKKARLMTVQFQNITGTSIDDFRDGKGEVVLWPDQYKAGEPILPFSSVKH